MMEPSSFEENRRQLYLKRLRELNERIDALRSRISRGEYDDADLAELRSILRVLRYDFVGNDTRLSQAMLLSGVTIAHTYEGTSRPKYPNFMKMLHGAQQLVTEMSLGDENQKFSDQLEPPPDLLDRSEALQRSPGTVRIRPSRSSIFLNDDDLVRLQNLAKTSGANISAIIGDALSQYKSPGEKGRLRSPAKKGTVEPVVIRNRVEVVRYSTAIINALQETLDYSIERHHNMPPPALRIDDDDYLKELRNLVSELRRLNGLLGRPSKSNARAARERANRFGKHFDKFLGSYAGTLGKGVAGLTIAAAVGLLHQAGVGVDVIESIWRHLRGH